MKAIFLGLNKIHLITLVGFAGFGGVFAAGMGRFLIYHLEGKVKRKPYYTQALDTLNKNPKAVDLIGKPIKVKGVNSNFQESMFTENRVLFMIQLDGSKLQGNLQVDSFKDEEDQWKISSLKFITKNNDKTFIIYRRKE